MAFLRRLAALKQPGSVSLSTKGPVAFLTLHNVARRNAISGPMMASLHEHMSTLEQWHEGSAVVLAGAGGTFCAGADLELVRSELNSPEAGRQMAAAMGDILHRLRQLPLLSVSAIEGHAIGGGAELATATDWRVMAPSAQLRFVHAKMGTSPGWGGAARLVQLVGRGAALRCLAHGTALRPADAMAIGLCDGVGDADEPAATAAERLLLAPAMAHTASIDALRAIKRVGTRAIIAAHARVHGLTLLPPPSTQAVAVASDVAEDVRLDEQRALASVWGSGANLRIVQGIRERGA